VLNGVAGDLSGGFGLLTSVVGILSEIFQQPILVPGWAWLAVGAGLLFMTACRIEWDLLAEKQKNRKPQPNMQLEDAVKHIIGEDEIREEHGVEVARVLAALREQALLGTLQVFARKGWRSAGLAALDSVPRSIVPAAYFEDHWISSIEFMSDHRGEINYIANSTPGEYMDVWFDLAQIDAVWPAPRRRITLRNPFKLSEA
jgi:hypothetical protein